MFLCIVILELLYQWNKCISYIIFVHMLSRSFFFIIIMLYIAENL